MRNKSSNARRAPASDLTSCSAEHDALFVWHVKREPDDTALNVGLHTVHLFARGISERRSRGCDAGPEIA